VSASAQDLRAVPRRFTRYGDAYAHAAATDGELRVSLPFWAVVLLCLSALFVVGDWLLVYWNISTAGGVATVYLPAWFPIEASSPSSPSPRSPSRSSPACTTSTKG